MRSATATYRGHVITWGDGVWQWGSVSGTFEQCVAAIESSDCENAEYPSLRFSAIKQLAHSDPFIYAQVTNLGGAISVSVWLTNCANLYNDMDDIVGAVGKHARFNPSVFRESPSPRILFDVAMFDDGEPKIVGAKVVTP